jgi:hypothetical protein
MTRSWTFLVRPSEEPSSANLAVSAKDTRVRFADGLEAFCATSGLWNVPLGYGREEIADAVARALRDASYLTLFRRSHSYAEEAAGRLIAFTGMPFSRVLFATSGGAANDLMMKLCRHYWAIEGVAPRPIVAGLRGSYHGLTFGAHALSGDELNQSLYGVEGRNVRHVPFDDGGAALEALFRREGDRIAALVIEPVLGTGAFEVPEVFLATVQRLRELYGFLLVADEVATGFGRTGVRFASAGWTPGPDALVLSKALTNGSCAASVIVVNERIAGAFARHDSLLVHGETQAGAPASCAAILATLDLFEQAGADELFRPVSAQLDRVHERLLVHPRVLGVRGRGAFRAVSVSGPACAAAEGTEADQTAGASPDDVGQLVERIRRRGVIVHPGPSAVQLIPAAVSDPDDIERTADAILGALDEETAA